MEEKYPHKCEECTQSFKKLGKLNRHIKEKHLNTRNFICDSCSKDFKRNSHLQRHKLIHSNNPKPFSCNIDNCIQKFSNKQHLERHINIIHSQQKIRCENCDITFNKKIQLLKHNTDAHGLSKPFVCHFEGCNSSFFKTSSLQLHQASHKITCNVNEQSIQCNNLISDHISRISHGDSNECQDHIRSEPEKNPKIEEDTKKDFLEEKSINIPPAMDEVNAAKKKKLNPPNPNAQAKTKANAKKNVYVCFYEKCMKAYTTVNVLCFSYINVIFF